jgi:hypothetical protein
LEDNKPKVQKSLRLSQIGEGVEGKIQKSLRLSQIGEGNKPKVQKSFPRENRLTFLILQGFSDYHKFEETSRKIASAGQKN